MRPLATFTEKRLGHLRIAWTRGRFRAAKRIGQVIGTKLNPKRIGFLSSDAWTAWHFVCGPLSFLWERKRPAAGEG